MAEHTPEAFARYWIDEDCDCWSCAACGTDWGSRDEASACTKRCAMKLKTWDDLLTACEAALELLQDRERFVVLGAMAMGQVEQVLRDGVAKVRGEE